MAGMRAVDPRVSFAELSTWPDDGRRWELYGGEPIAVPSPSWTHQRVAVELVTLLKDYERHAGGGVVAAPFDIVLSEYDVLQPDVVYFGATKRAMLDPLQAGHIVPDLAVEVLSRSTEARDRGRKMALLGSYGLPEYWLVDPVSRVVEIYGLSIGGRLEQAQAFESPSIAASATLPGLTFGLERLFAG